jgi:AraC-like DNA-binding protein
MTVQEFNTDKGLYIFELDNIETEFHSHPTVEIVIAKKGTFNLSTDKAEYQNLKFAVIAANQKHKLSSTNCRQKIIMIEHHNRMVSEYLSLDNITLKNGYYFQTLEYKKKDTVDKIVKEIKDNKSVLEYDHRITDTINYLSCNDLEYGLMIKTLQSVTHLSESRLSHLFKASIGISLKKYLIWSKLKSTIKLHLNTQSDMFSSLVKNGFYDQPHFSRSFKNWLGVNPSKAYNSRILQVLTNAT